MLSDAEIVRRVRRGRVDEFRQLVERYQRSAFTLAYRMTGRWDEAEDAAQDAFVKAFRSIHTFSEGAAFWPWLRRITINCSLDRMSCDVTVDCIDTLTDCQEPFVDAVEDTVLSRLESEDIRRAISDLPQAYRSVVVLKYLEDLSAPEIAEALDISAGAVRVRLHRALGLLVDRLAVMKIEL